MQSMICSVQLNPGTLEDAMGLRTKALESLAQSFAKHAIQKLTARQLVDIFDQGPDARGILEALDDARSPEGEFVVSVLGCFTIYEVQHLFRDVLAAELTRRFKAHKVTIEW